jgi:protein-disulfide isomerase
MFAVAAVVIGVRAVYVFRQQRTVQAAEAQLMKPRPVTNWAEVVGVSRRADTSTGPIHVVEFGDYQCPGCGRIYAILDSVARRRGHALSIGFVHYPLKAIHPFAWQAARAADCSADQGAFVRFHEYLYRHQHDIGSPNWLTTAEKSTGIQPASFEACLSDSSRNDRVARGASMAGRMGINATPTFIVDGMMYPGVPPTDVFERLAVEPPTVHR